MNYSVTEGFLYTNKEKTRAKKVYENVIIIYIYKGLRIKNIVFSISV